MKNNVEMKLSNQGIHLEILLNLTFKELDQILKIDDFNILDLAAIREI